ncbi:MAG: PorV/PorQ family protein [Ignavibacteriales bacterium]|nr:PorV/PorQ family protein [Ignavibacteriales bacterium]
MKRFVILLLLWVSIAAAQGTSSGAAFLKLPLHPRVASLGEALIADQGSIPSLILNPSNIFGIQQSEVSISHTQWIQDIASQELIAAIPFDIGTCGIAVSSTSVSGIEIRDIPGPPSGTFDARAAAFEGIVATEIVSQVSAGVGFKYLYEKIYVEEHSGLGVDAGITYRTPFEGLSVGASLVNAGSLEAVKSIRSDLPQRFLFGGSYQFKHEDFGLASYLGYDVEKKPNPNRLLAGLECSYQSLLFVRAGYRSGDESRLWSFGLGVRYSMISADYAVVPFSLSLGNASLISLAIRF